jgi:chromate transport protein ChrA
MASGDPLVVYIVFGVVLAWIAVISLQFLIKFSKKAQILSALNIILGLAFFAFLMDVPYNHKLHLVSILIVIGPIFCGITNILMLKYLR